jgi:hypothetical protein
LKRDGSLEDERTTLLNEQVFKVFASGGDYEKDLKLNIGFSRKSNIL